MKDPYRAEVRTAPLPTAPVRAKPEGEALVSGFDGLAGIKARQAT
jgi:hypothetical protein